MLHELLNPIRHPFPPFFTLFLNLKQNCNFTRMPDLWENWRLLHLFYVVYAEKNSCMLLLSLLPPISVLIVGYLTRKIILALLFGILFAAFIATQYQLIPSIKLAGSHFLDNCQPTADNFLICLFLLLLGVLVTTLQHSGGAYAYSNKIKRYLTSQKNTESASLILSSLLFIDDYLSSLTLK